jgi:hypothetical protein
MSKPQSTGYGDSPDTTDPDAAGTTNGAPGDSDAVLTTDDSAQRDDALERPGNEPD